MPESTVRIDGEHAIITASGSGIGLQIATRLTSAGINVVLNDIDADALSDAANQLASNDGAVTTVEGDVSDPDVAQELVDTAVSAFGGLDIVVNNVGIAGPTKMCEEITKDEFMNTLDVNVGSVFNLSKAALPQLKEQDYGRIINISSISGKRPLEGRTPYTTAKMGIIGFTRTLATEVADNGINVNAICPGSVKGPRLDSVIENQARNQDRPVEDVEREFREVSPMNEFVHAEDIAETVLYLCSRQADKITGQDVNVSAGVVMY